ncbi:MAG: hypothetical protein AAFQ43_00135 [Bacteroidota bacterium]
MADGEGYFHQELGPFGGQDPGAEELVGLAVADEREVAPRVAGGERAGDVLHREGRRLGVETRRLGLGEVEADARELGVGEDDPRERRVVGLGVETLAGVPGRERTLVGRRVDEHLVAEHVTGPVDALGRGAERDVDGEEAAGIRGDAEGLQAEALGIAAAARREEEVRAADFAGHPVGLDGDDGFGPLAPD